MKKVYIVIELTKTHPCIVGVYDNRKSAEAAEHEISKNGVWWTSIVEKEVQK